jgi:hypothetical protein
MSQRYPGNRLVLAPIRQPSVVLFPRRLEHIGQQILLADVMMLDGFRAAHA